MIAQQMRQGIRKAIKIKETSANNVSLDAGCNRNLASQFLGGDNDIKMKTLEKLCVDGLGMSFNDILILGQMNEN